MKQNVFFEKPAPMTPVDRVAVRVMLGGESFVPKKIVLTGDSEYPIETRKANFAELGQSTFIDLTGYKFGRFVVVGLAKDFQRKWVVKCSCGRYSMRHAKSIKNPENVQDRCEHCRHLAFLKREEAYRRTGLDQDIRDF